MPKSKDAQCGGNALHRFPWELLGGCHCCVIKEPCTDTAWEGSGRARGAQSFALWLPQVKLIDYIHRQRQCKLSVPLSDRTAELNSYPRFNDWLDIVNVRKEVVQVRMGPSLSPPVPSGHSQLPAGSDSHSRTSALSTFSVVIVLCSLPSVDSIGQNRTIVTVSHTHIELSPLTAKQGRKGFFYSFSRLCLCRPGHNVLIRFPLIVKEPKFFFDLSRNLPG